MDPIPEAERDDLLAAYYLRLTDPDPAVHMPAARTWKPGICAEPVRATEKFKGGFDRR